MNPIKSYLDWLQQDVPVGTVERYPEINEKYETSVKDVYIIGDLTGIPLLKIAAESGANLVRNITQDSEFDFKENEEPDVLDIVIVGAGPAGISAALECQKKGFRYLVLEVSKLFNTIENFPKGKLILAKPDELKAKSLLQIKDGNKETLLEDLKSQIAHKEINLKLDTMVQKITRHADYLELETNTRNIKARKVILAIGKSGNGRRLKVPGENLPKVFNKLYDASDYQNMNVLVVGGGDSAIEASVALAKAGSKVTHSYRKEEFSRPKEENKQDFEEQVQKGNIKPLFNSQVKEIKPAHVLLETKEGVKEFENDSVFSLIGRELPLAFFKRSKIKMEGEKSLSWYTYLIAMISFFTMLYFGKSGFATDLFSGTEGWISKVEAYLVGPFLLQPNWSFSHYAWYSPLNFYLGWIGSLIWLISGSMALWFLWQQREKYFGTTWNRIKYSYLTFVAASFTWIYFSNMLSQNAGWVKEPTYWYSFFYCTTMALFGVRRALIRKTRYIKIQMATLIFIQVFFLFLLPYHLYEPLILNIFGPDSYIVREIFPNGGWSSFGLVLLWPLNINTFGSSTFWTWFPFVQTFGILYYIVYRFGKGAYCGWICSCGGMAETLGDEYRQKSPHGPTAKKMEHIGQFVLVYIVLATALSFAVKNGWFPQAGRLADTAWGIYKITIDVFFAGVLGLGVYFFMGGRIWCRYGCPLAALMHIYTRFSRYRILSEKKKCISCNICTKVCHMGIDVMNYANKGIPLNDVECVRCSACVQSCPTEVLSFEELNKGDSQNKSREQIPSYGKEDWRAGIR